MKKLMSLALVLALGLAFAGMYAVAGDNCSKTTSASKTTATQASSTDKAGCTSAQTAGATTASAEHCSKDAASCNMNGKLTAGHCDPSWCSPEDCAQWTKACEAYGPNAEIRMMSVKGMTCTGCENSIKTALTTTPGVVQVVKVDHKAGVAIVIVDKTTADNNTLATTVTNKGYEAQIMPAVATTTTGTAAQKTDAKKAGCAATCATPCAKGQAADTKSDKPADKSTTQPH